jgi:hypothetical protein
LACDPAHILVTALKINVLTGERLKCFKLGLGRQIPFGPIVDGLAPDQKIRHSGRVANLEHVRKLLE